MSRNFGLFVFLSSLALVHNSALACSTLSPAGKKEKEKLEERYLRENSDKIVRGVWRSDKAERDPEYEYLLFGHIEVKKGKRTLRYRVAIPGEINCGFPYYYVEDGDRGRFYLHKDEDPFKDDLEDGFIDNFKYVHFKRSGGK